MNKITGKLKNYGFQTPVIKIEDHIFGSAEFSGAILIPSGDWSSYRPQYEAQADNFETQGCTVWGTENAIEYLYKFHFGIEKNYEELPPYIGAGLHPDMGGDPNKVAQWIRDNGLVEAPNCPFPKLKEILLTLLDTEPSYILGLGRNWNCKLRHQWVLQGYEPIDRRMQAIKAALPYGIVGASFTAWFKNEEGIYVDNGQRNTHWAVIEKATDKGWQVFDTYDHSVKIYSYDSRIDFAKLYFLEKKLTLTQKKSIWQILCAFLFGEPEELKKLEPILNPNFMPPNTDAEVPCIPTPQMKLEHACLESVGKDLSVQAPDELGCADSLSRLLARVFPDFPSFLSTIALNSHLLGDKRFTGTNIEPWAIIVSPTVGKNVGHCGVLGADSKTIYSNNSKTGKWDRHWTIDEWVDYYRVKKGLKIRLYKI